ncbi:MAG TPA: alpha/beta fold hydrolase [Sphingomicrobium sp.]|nr:alpha/beta fold hydrolase [Sphingomicrobium sp.]
MKWQGDDRPPKAWKRFVELGWNFRRLWHLFGPTGPIGAENGPPVLVIPGFLASDRTTLGLRKALAEAGWRVHPWGMGLNTGVKEDTLQRLEACVDAISKEPILVIGWSLGGLYARELSRHAPTKVRAVVTLGSPFSGDLHQNNVWRLYELVAGHKVEDTPIPRITEKPPVPHLAIWSRRDGIVAPRAAYGLDDERDDAVELDCAHMAFAISRKAARRVVQEIDRFLKKHA